ncbi:hypothetical protein RCL_jg14430.t1 [Rhizophagus clarus]|uniref:Uncharacterized protein n=1 Tax=Rhizophagus clarus TaxID=94130 RepID=A0A8H3QT33_9GLOM|nr:hypothetical protein RCL_jg14430.t1 [Rhizophagus clarus]
MNLITCDGTAKKKSSNQFFVYEAECNIVKTKYIDSKFLLNFGVILREIIFSIVRASWRDRRRNGWDNLFRKFSVVKSRDNNFVISNRSIIIDTFRKKCKGAKK